MKKTITMLGAMLTMAYGLSGGSSLFAQHGHGSAGAGAGMGVHGMDSVSMGHAADQGNRAGAMTNTGSATNTTTTATPKNHSMTAESHIDTRLQNNTVLSTRLQTLLPTRTNLQTAAQGFKNVGQFVAAVHVAHNLNIPFDQLKARMMTGASLGKAIAKLDPSMTAKQAKAAAATANNQAEADIKASAKTKESTNIEAAETQDK
jgi:hypothetical protein